MRLGGSVSLDSAAKATVILLSYNRIRNIEPIVRSILKCDFVETLIVSNDEPSIRIENWVNLDDDRVVLMNQPENRGPSYRWKLAQQSPGRYYLAIDDDLFLYPEQLLLLFSRLVERPETPHGLAGSCLQVPHSLRNCEFFERREMEVDILHQVYAFTWLHLTKFWTLVEERFDSWSYQTPGDDILISHTGVSRPMIHDVGLILRCSTASAKGVALWQQEGRGCHRERILRQIRQEST